METTLTKAPANADDCMEAFHNWIEQRPGLDPRNYISDYRDTAGRAAYRSDQRLIVNQKHRALAALNNAFADWVDYDPTLMDEACSRAFSGRLEFNTEHELIYCTGQYWPTEYRLAAAVVLETYRNLIHAKDVAAQPPKPYTYESMADVIAANEDSGRHFFEPSSLKFFGSRVESGLIAGQYFITSEKDLSRPRLYTIRQARPDGSIKTVGQFQQYASRKEAMQAIKALIA